MICSTRPHSPCTISTSLRIWDERRLIIPLQWFIENPFQNWTRATSELVGTVLLHVDYAMPIEPPRTEARRRCEVSKDWDGRLCLLQVTEAGERTPEVRALVTAGDSTRKWDLRCFVREGLVSYLQREYPQHLPTLRTRRIGEIASVERGVDRVACHPPE